MRRFAADTLALILFCTLAAGLVEIFVVGLSPAQIVQTRLAAVPAILVTARPYGLWRDFVLSRLGGARPGPARAMAADMFAFVSFQAPVYAAILAFAGASAGQVALAIPSAVIAMIVAGRPYGVFLDWMRRVFRVEPQVEAV